MKQEVISDPVQVIIDRKRISEHLNNASAPAFSVNVRFTSVTNGYQFVDKNK